MIGFMYRPMLIDREADQESHRVARDELVGLVGIGELEALRNALISASRLEPGCRLPARATVARCLRESLQVGFPVSSCAGGGASRRPPEGLVNEGGMDR